MEKVTTDAVWTGTDRNQKSFIREEKKDFLNHNRNKLVALVSLLRHFQFREKATVRLNLPVQACDFKLTQKRKRDRDPFLT